MNKLGTENSKIMTNKIEVYFCHKVKLRRSSSRACMYIPTQEVVSFPWWYFVHGFHSPHQLMSQDSVGDTVVLSISSSEDRRKKEGPSPSRIFSQKKRERRVKRDNETVFTSRGLVLSQKLGVSVLWKMGERSPQQFQNN